MSSLFYRGIYGMVNNFRFLLCTLACFFSITTYASDLPANPRNDTPAQSLKRLQNNFKSQDNYDAGMKRNLAELDARIYMNEGTKRTSVEQMLTRSGVLESGGKAEVVAKVTQPVDTGKAAKTLADRLGKAKDYAKHAGKASIPAFVGGAAVQALVDGVGWVIDEGGEVKRLPTEQDPDPTTSPCSSSNDNCSYAPTLFWVANYERLGTYSSELSAAKAAWKGGNCAPYSPLVKGGDSYYRSGGDCLIGRTLSKSNPNYSAGTPAPTPDLTATPEQIQTALKNALESNNPALAAAIAEALKAAYSFDGTEGQDNSTNTAVIGTANDMNEAVDRAFDNPTTNATSDKPSGYYKITDGEKTIEGYVTTPDTKGKTETETKTTTTTDPVTGNQTTTGTSTGSLQLPAFCDWAAIVCDWINWTKEEPQEPELKPVFEEIEVPYTPFSIAKFNAQCPPDENLSLNLMGQEMSFVFPMKPFCDFFSGIKPFVIALASFWAVKLIGNASFNSGN